MIRRPMVLLNRSGQAMAELVVVLPLLFALVGAAMVITYICWQGVKVQQAANLAARIQGQERVAGGTSIDTINLRNGVNPGGSEMGDADPSERSPSSGGTDWLSQKFQQNRPAPKSVYEDYYLKVRAMFGAGAQDGLYIPPPKIGNYSDRVKVVRVIKPPTIVGLEKMDPVMLEGVAYGGEDPFMYALPRWGDTLDKPNENYWESVIRKRGGCPSGVSKCP